LHFNFKHSFEDVYNRHPGLAGIPWYTIAGNHDHMGNIGAQLEYTDKSLSQKWLNQNNKKIFV
jgi:tartrate-resistant acid phosphatase type 5